MPAIYSNATETLVWLGEATDEAVSRIFGLRELCSGHPIKFIRTILDQVVRVDATFKSGIVPIIRRF
jgi:hypothetical protein